MGTFQSFEEIEAWEKARNLTNSKDFGLRDQIRRASVSILSNIAEGFERGGGKEFVQFLSMAKGSAGEIKTHLYIALDQKYIEQETFNRLFALTSEIARIIGGLMNYLRQTRIKGLKFKTQLETRNSKLETYD